MRKVMLAAVLGAALAAAPAALAEEAKKPDASGTEAYSEATRAMTDSMMRMMGRMFKMWSEASRPIWSSAAQMFGEYGAWCSTCHAQLDGIYQQLGSTYDPNVHKKLSDADLKKAAEAYKAQKKK
ncbi:MAG TPA: hypothetical protein ENK15_09735 [Thermopetrobacter sp.]|nr:hypothetical protein [Thermopetrobacter sp.]